VSATESVIDGGLAVVGVPASDAAPATGSRVRLGRLAPVVAVALAVVVAMLTISPWPVGIFEDDAMYTILAKSLAEGHGYRFLNLPGAPNATHYPPGYPALLALLWKVYPRFPDNIVLFKFANAALLGLAAYGTLRFARERLGMGTLGALATTLAATATIPILLVTGVVMSEPLFLAALLPTLLLAERAAERGTVRDAALAGLAAGALAMVRTLGAFVIPALLLVLLLRRRVRAAVALAAAGAVSLVPWQLWTAAHEGEIPHVFLGKYGSYTKWVLEGYAEHGLALLRGVVGTNLSAVVGTITYTLMPTRPPWPRIAALVVVAMLVALAARRLWRKAPVTSLFLGAYLAVVLAWPFEPDRFVIAIAPLIAFVLAEGVAAVREWTPSAAWGAWARRGALLGAAALACGFAVYNWRGASGRWWESIQRGTAEMAKPVVEWVARYTAPTDVLSVDHDLLVYLYTGRLSVPYLPFVPTARVAPLTEAEQDSAFRDVLRAYRVNFLITGSKPGVELGQRLAGGEAPTARLLGSTRTAYIFEIH
jgi:hypothetical protein